MPSPIDRRIELNPALHQWPTYLMGQLHRALHSKVGRNLRDHWVLTFIIERSDADDLSQQHICDGLGLDRSEMVRLLDRMEEQGWVQRCPSPSDRRRHNIVITPAGRREVEQIDIQLAQAHDDVLRLLTADEREQLHALLLKANGID